MGSPDTSRRIMRALKEHPAETAEQEAALLQCALKGLGELASKTPLIDSDVQNSEAIGGIHQIRSQDGAKVTLSGCGISDGFPSDLRGWLRTEA